MLEVKQSAVMLASIGKSEQGVIFHTHTLPTNQDEKFNSLKTKFQW